MSILRTIVCYLVASIMYSGAFGQTDSLTLFPYKKRVNFHQKFEPKGVLIGAGQVKTQFTIDFAEATKRKPYMHMDYAGLYRFRKLTPKTDSLINRVSQLSWPCALQLGLSMTSDGKPELHYEHKVANGDFDTEIANLATVLKRVKTKVFLRVGYEFNGEWNGYEPETYKSAYIRLVTALKKAGCKNVAYIWCFSPDGKNHDFMKYYPGDKYVDWWAIDLFGQQHFNHPATLAFADSSLVHKRPLMIGESTARKTDLADTEVALKRWFVPYFNFIRSHPNVKSFCYINENWSTTFLPDWGDARIQINPAIQQWVEKELSNSFYTDASK